MNSSHSTATTAAITHDFYDSVVVKGSYRPTDRALWVYKSIVVVVVPAAICSPNVPAI